MKPQSTLNLHFPEAKQGILNFFISVSQPFVFHLLRTFSSVVYLPLKLRNLVSKMFVFIGSCTVGKAFYFTL